MKKSLALILAALIILGVIGITASAETGGVKINLNGEIITLVAYNINGNNYFKLRDVANLLKGTEAQFDVIWNEDKGAIELISNTPYSTEEEITSEILENPIATSSYVTIYKDGEIILLGAYNIAGNNFFKLRDIASAFNFGVDWNANEQIIEIDTSKEYVFPEGTSFGLNTEYLSLIGMTKGEIDKKFGEGTYFAEFGMTDYKNGIMLGWNSLGEIPTDKSVATNMYITLGNLFFDCPDPITVDQIKSQFNSSSESYNEMDDERVLNVNYCGKAITFNIGYYLGPDSYAFINSAINYENPYIETYQVNNVKKPEISAYYEYAVAHEGEFWNINQDWRDDKEYFYLVDVDHDGLDEMVVKIGCGVAIYKELSGKVEQVFYDRLPDSSGIVQYWVTEYEGKDYIIYVSGGSSEYKTLNILKDGKLEKHIESFNIMFDEFVINGETVSKATYDSYVNGIEYINGMLIDELK